MSPVIPFLSEKIYENLVLNINKNAPSSIHLTDFPIVNKDYVNEDLVNGIDTIKDIVSLGRSARNKANLKIRQPLLDVKILIDSKYLNFINKNKLQIIEELNVKNIEFVKSSDEIVNYQIKPNFNMLGQKYGKKINEIVQFLKNCDTTNFIKIIESEKEYSIKNTDYTIVSEDIEIVENALNDYSLSSNKNIIVSLNTKLTEDLVNEGLVRDLIRKVQNSRKELGFEVEDRISIDINCPEEFYNALNTNLEYFKNETLCTSLSRVDSINSGKIEKININSKNIQLSIKKVLVEL
tara:strand:- start:1949 stop:2830 length:882 start_codon:yes stop_codon:yes gene_type:complete